MSAAGRTERPATLPARAATAAHAATLALAALWLLPPLFPFAERPSLHFYREWLAGAVGVAACVLWLFARPAHVAVPRTAVLLLGLGAFVLLQTPLIDAPYWTPALGYAAYLAWAAILATAVAGIRDLTGAEAVIQVIAWTAVLGGILGAGAGLMQCFGAPELLDALVAYTPHGSVRGNLQHRSYFADQMLLGVVCAAFLFARRRLAAGVLVPALALMAIALSLTGSRATLLALPLLLLAAVATRLRSRSQDSARLLAALCLAGVAFVGSEAVLPHLPSTLFATPEAATSTLSRWITEADEGGTAPRWVLWHKSAEIFAAHPVAGVGPDGFTWHFYRALESTTALPYTIHSHNLITQSLVSFGLLGTVIVVTLLAAWAWQYRERLLALEWWPVTAMLVVLFLRALLDLNFWFAHLLAPAVVLLGLADLKGWAWQGTRARLAFGASLAIAAVVLVATLHSYRQIAGIWTERPSASEIDRRLAEARRNPFFTPLVDSIVADATTVDAHSGLAQLALNSRSMNWRPTARMVWRQTALLAMNGYERQGCDLLVKARRIYPRHEKAFRALLDRAGSPPPAPIAALRAQLDALAAGALPQSVCGAIQSTP
jgi:O-antigen ligase